MFKDDKSPENFEILTKGNNSCKSSSKATKVEVDLYYVKTNSYTKFQVNITKDRREVWKITRETVGQTRQKSNLICIMSRQIHIPHFKSISQRTTDKSSENRVDGRTDRQKDRRLGNL